MVKSKQLITLVINTKNEQKNIAKCIKSAAKFVDEILVADMNSEDDTVKIAKSLGAYVITVKDYGYVEPARNYAVSKASNPWVLILDADEQLSRALGNKLRKIAKENKYDVVKIPRKNKIFQKWIKHTFYWPDYQIRLYKKGSVTWSDVIHKQPQVKGRLLQLEAVEANAILHSPFESIGQWLNKTNKYTDFSAYLKNNQKVTLEDLRMYTLGEFAFRFKDQKGYKDGTHGYVISKLMEFYRFLEFLKYWELKNYPDLLTSEELNSLRDNLGSDMLKSQNELNEIKSSKFYKLWQIYLLIKDKLLFKKTKN